MSEGTGGRIRIAEHVIGAPGSAVAAGGSSSTVSAAATVLQEGGSAVDAALAGMFAAAMTEPVLSSLGGGGFLLHAEPTGVPQYLDFFVDTPGLGGQPRHASMTSVRVVFGRPDQPQAEQVFHAGWASVAVPGCFAGYLDAHARWGSLPLARIVAPAIELARHGVVLDDIQRDFLRLVADVLAVTPASAALYASAMEGAPFVNPGYAQLLSALAAGATMTDPVFSDPLLRGMADHDGLITAEDLSTYTPRLRTPLTMMRGSAQVWTNPPPSFGGTIVLEALGGIDEQPTVDWARVARSLREATAQQRSRDLAAQSMTVSRGTTSISVIDARGRMATCTTSNGSSSGTQVDGVQLNNMLGEEDLNPTGLHALPPGVRMGSMMTPTMVDLPDGARVTFGSGGSERIRSAHVAVLTRLIDEQSTLRDAVTGPRVHATANGIEVEPGIDPDTFDTWSDVGTVRWWPQRDLFFGGVHAVRLNVDGTTEAIGDARRGGCAAVVDTA